jgi:glycosyltransferase involved in cell wall biosynthesis
VDNPLVSIIIPTYNVEQYVEECIESVLAQSYSNIEIIIIDDYSTDVTPKLINAYSDRAIVLFNESNRGQGFSRNKGMDLAKGKYILFVDSDDWIEEKTVEELVFSAEKAQSDIVRYNGTSFVEGNNNVREESLYDFGDKLKEGYIYEKEELLTVNKKSFSASPCLFLLNAKIVKENNIQFPEGILHEDEYFTTMVFAQSKKMTFVNKNFYHRRYRSSSTMTEITPRHKRKSFDSYMEVFKLLEKEYLSDKYDRNQKKFIKRQLISIYHGMKKSNVAPILKKDLKKLNSISVIDKLRIQISLLRKRI